MDINFTYLKEKKRDKILDFLEKEINDLSYLVSLQSNSTKNSNKIFTDYTDSLFVVSDDDNDGDVLILN